MQGYLLDTQTICYWFDHQCAQFKAVATALQQLAPQSPLYISAITWGEIEYGHAFEPSGAGFRRDAFVDFVRNQLPQVVDVSRHTGQPYGRIRAHLAKRFPPSGGWSKNKKRRMEQLYDPVTACELGIDENDLWLVAQAVERNLVFVTSDKMIRIREAVKELYPDFEPQNWAASVAG